LVTATRRAREEEVYSKKKKARSLFQFFNFPVCCKKKGTEKKGGKKKRKKGGGAGVVSDTMRKKRVKGGQHNHHRFGTGEKRRGDPPFFVSCPNFREKGRGRKRERKGSPPSTPSCEHRKKEREKGKGHKRMTKEGGKRKTILSAFGHRAMAQRENRRGAVLPLPPSLPNPKKGEERKKGPWILIFSLLQLWGGKKKKKKSLVSLHTRGRGGERKREKGGKERPELQSFFPSFLLKEGKRKGEERTSPWRATTRPA